jgi:hypothetical protein
MLLQAAQWQRRRRTDGQINGGEEERREHCREEKQEKRKGFSRMPGFYPLSRLSFSCMLGFKGMTRGDWLH